jgi:hypothetical protein
MRNKIETISISLSYLKRELHQDNRDDKRQIIFTIYAGLCMAIDGLTTVFGYVGSKTILESLRTVAKPDTFVPYTFETTPFTAWRLPNPLLNIALEITFFFFVIGAFRLIEGYRRFGLGVFQASLITICALRLFMGIHNLMAINDLLNAEIRIA